jgi:two-component system response regulator
MNRDAPIHILLAEDDPDDRLFTRRALSESRVATRLTTVENGEELLHYLRHDDNDKDQDGEHPPPDLILLDLNMPRMDGREALREMKSDPELRRIPVVVLTTSEADQDVLQSYDLGVNAFMTKPVSFNELAEAMDSLGAFWFDFVKLPSEHDLSE